MLAPPGTRPAWPPFLPPPETFSPGVIATVERVWADPTIHRRVEGAPAAVPLGVYVAFVDAPEVTAAAARRLGLARYEVRMLDEDWYEADDRDGARGVYRVLVRDGTRRVILSQGTHTGALLGTIGGSALTLLELTDHGGKTTQRLDAFVLIESRPAAALARILILVFGWIADRKLGEGFRVTAGVAEWAAAHRGEFCEWLAREPLPRAGRDRLLEALPACARPADRRGARVVKAPSSPYAGGGEPCRARKIRAAGSSASMTASIASGTASTARAPRSRRCSAWRSAAATVPSASPTAP